MKHTEPGEFTDAELHSSRIDQHKARIDVLKHVATLDTGALLVVVAFMEKVIPAAQHRAWVGVAVILLLASLGASGFACLDALSSFPRKGVDRPDRADRRDGFVAMLVTFLGFFLGVLCLAFFFAMNWWF